MIVDLDNILIIIYRNKMPHPKYKHESITFQMKLKAPTIRMDDTDGIHIGGRRRMEQQHFFGEVAVPKDHDVRRERRKGKDLNQHFSTTIFYITH